MSGPSASAIKRLAQPILAYPNSKFETLHAHVSAVGEATEKHLEARLNDRIDHSKIDELLETTRHLLVGVAESTMQLQLEASNVRRRVEELIEPSDPEVIVALLRRDPWLADRFAAAVVATPPDQLPEWVATLANWLASHVSPASAQGVWINEPISLRHEAGRVAVGSVNERILELPFVFGATASLPAGSTILDLGSSESIVSLALASLGMDVISVDPRGYGFEHPGVRVVATPVQEWDGPDQPLDAVISLSTIEHLGIGSYGQDLADAARQDRTVLELLRSWTAPGGTLVLTAPYGAGGQDELQRIYDEETLAALLEGWTVEDLRFARQVDAVTWVACEAGDLASAGVDDHGVVLVRARNT